MAAVLKRGLTRYSDLYQRRPFGTSFLTCFVKGGIADVIAQTIIEQNDDISVRRAALFALWSGAYCGSGQHFIFNTLFGRVFGTATTVRVALSKACADSFIATPLLGIPIYYACKPIIESTAGAGPMDGLREYADGFWDFYWKPAMVWIPAHLVTFSVVPVNFRIGWISFVSLGWLSFVSMTSHKIASSSTE
jgi:protein Mpv17